MEKLINAMEPALIKLSETLNVSIDFLKENAMFYIMEYGRYHLAKQLTAALICTTIIGATWASILLVLLYDEYHGKWKLSKKKLILAALAPFLIISIILIVTTVMPYLASPEMYSIEKILKLVK